MNEAQRSVLQRHHQQLADDIMISETLLGSLFQNKIFERNMIEIIKAEKTPTDQVHKMLSMLPRRGPDAFDTFIRIIQDDYPWLAATLEASLKAELALSRSSSNVVKEVCPSARERGESCVPVFDQPFVEKDIKSRVGVFVHKQFGQSKRISEKDKRSVERWMADQLQQERQRLQSMSAANDLDAGTDSVDGRLSADESEAAQLQENLDRTYAKVRKQNMSSEVNNNGSDEVPCFTPGLASFPMIDVELDSLISRFENLDSQVSQCHFILGDKERKHPLPTLIQDLHFESSAKDKELKKEKLKVETMLTELYDYSKTINKLESQRNQHRLQLENRQNEIQRLKMENESLTDKCKTLEAINIQHAEKEKTLENLRKMMKELKSSRDNAVDENMNFRNRVDTQASPRNYRRPTRNYTGRRGSLVENNMNLNSSVRRNAMNKPAIVKRKSFPTHMKPM